MIFHHYSLEQLLRIKNDPSFSILKAPARRSITYRINSMQGKHKTSPAQKRARLLGQLKYYSLAAKAMISQCTNLMRSANDTDLCFVHLEMLDSYLASARYSTDRLTKVVSAVNESTKAQKPKQKQEGAEQ